MGSVPGEDIGEEWREMDNRYCRTWLIYSYSESRRNPERCWGCNVWGSGETSDGRLIHRARVKSCTDVGGIARSRDYEVMTILEVNSGDGRMLVDSDENKKSVPS